MQREMSRIVFQAPTPAPLVQYTHKHRQAAKNRDHFDHGDLGSDAMDARERNNFDHRYGALHAGKDTADHFRAGQQMLLADEADLTTRLHEHNRTAGPKDTMTSESINDRKYTFDIVYGSQHEEKDTLDHFHGMKMEADEATLREEARVAEHLKAYEAARAHLRDEEAHMQEQTHMGHEQADRKHGDTYDHFQDGGGMAMEADADGASHHQRHHAYANRHALDHFGAHGMNVESDASFVAHKRDAMSNTGESGQSIGSTPMSTHHHALSIVNKHRSSHTLLAPPPPDFQNASLAVSPNYLRRASSREMSLMPLMSTLDRGARLAQRKKAQMALPPAGSPSGFLYMRQAHAGASRGSMRPSSSTGLLHRTSSSSSSLGSSSMSAYDLPSSKPGAMGVGFGTPARLTSSTSASRLRAPQSPSLHGNGVTPSWWGWPTPL